MFYITFNGIGLVGMPIVNFALCTGHVDLKCLQSCGILDLTSVRHISGVKLHRF